MADRSLPADVVAAHAAAVAAGEAGYLDPVTGLFVLTAAYLRDRGECCGRGCRHCPWRAVYGAAVSLDATRKDAAMPDVGTLVWFEIPADDPERAKRFYGGLFGWTFEPFDDFAPDYWAIGTAGSSVNGGIVPRSGSVAPGPGPVVYAAVADLEAAAEEAVRLGGRVVQPRTLITEQAGSFVLVEDPEGNVVGLWSE